MVQNKNISHWLWKGVATIVVWISCGYAVLNGATSWCFAAAVIGRKNSMLDRVMSRIDPLIPYCKDKTILTIGCCGMGINDVLGGKDFHLSRVNEVAKEVVGVDINTLEIEKLNKLGYNIIEQSADEPFALDINNKFCVWRMSQDEMFQQKKFDVIIAEEVIEHLQDLRVFLNNVKRHLKPDGTFLITSPSPFAWSYILQNIFLGIEQTNNAHTCWFSRKTMKYLLEHNGFEVVSIRTIDAVSENFRGRILQNLLRWLPARFGINCIYEARLKRNE